MVNEKIMTDRSLIVLALDALDELNYSNSTESAEYQYYEATKLLRAALEQPQDEQEPVAWISPSTLEWITRESEKVVKLTRKAQPEYDFTEPLYIHPQPKREPLTDKEISIIAEKYIERLQQGAYKLFARAIEAAHGIKENP